MFEASAIKPSQLSSFDVIIYGGGLYAGGIGGVKLVTKNQCKSLIVFTVGLADPATTDYSPILSKNFTQDMLSKTKLFHLRGGMDYKRLNLIHKGMMALMRKETQKKDPSKLNEEDRLFLETYGKVLDFMDKTSIQPILDHMNTLGESE